MSLRRHFSGLGIALAMLSGALVAQTTTVTGVVTNRTVGKPSGGDDVVLVQLAQGMQEVARTRTDARGRFSIKVPEGGMHLLRVMHDRANYFKPIQAGTQSVEMDVFTAAAEVEGVGVSEDVMQIQTTPDGSSLRVVEHFLVKNESQPAKTLFSDHPFEFYLPAGATVDGSSAKAPGGMAVEQPLVPMGDANHYTMLFPIRPGETEFNIWFKLPYKDKFTFQPRLTMATDALGIMMPKSMNFKGGASTPYQPVTEGAVGRAQAFLARDIHPSQPLEFTVTGKGELPRDNAVASQAGGAGARGAGGDTAGGNTDPNADTRPGGGLGTPLDKDADRDPWQKYRWWILGGVGLLLAAIAGFILSRPGPGEVAGRTSAGGALQALRDEMFALETDRLEGKLSEAQYVELKTAYDTVLRRAMQRSGPGAVVTE